MTRIYLIEHDREFAEILHRILETEGFEVSCANSVDEALLEVSEINPSLTIIDLDDGTPVKLEDLKQFTSQVPDTPILVTTNYKIPDLACKAIGVGASDYLLKPYGTQEMLERIHTLVGTNKTSGNGSSVDKISESIKFITSMEDILNITIEQLTKTLHMSDCFIALESNGSYSVATSVGYKPDPTSRVVPISKRVIDCLSARCRDPLELSTNIVGEIIYSLGIHGHGSFPTIMPLVHNDDKSFRLLGFIIGHGALVLDENDILEMERFLDQVVKELSTLIDSGKSVKAIAPYDHESEIIIPQVPREKAITKILEHVRRYYSGENDQVWIRLALDEAINNAIIHGHSEPLEYPAKNIKVKLSLGPFQLMFVVEDQGEGFDYENLPDPTAEENLLNINGRGIFIMRNIMDQVIYNEKGNQVALVKKLDGKPLGPEKLRKELSQENELSQE